jgi:uncharacterized protein with PIN domain
VRFVELRLYAALNDFLPRARRGRTLHYALFGTPSVKDVLEAVGVPHPEVAFLLIDGVPGGFGQRLFGGERVAAYPEPGALAIDPALRVSPAPQTPPRFLLDGHLATLAASLRLFGFDAALPPGADDATLARCSAQEDRTLLTRDLGLLKRGEVRRGAFIRATSPREQEREVVQRFTLLPHFAPLTRCSVCNAPLAAATPEEVAARVPPEVRARLQAFRACPGCGRVYWEGSHPARIRERIASLRGALAP